MNSLVGLRRLVERFHCLLGITFAFIGLLTFILEYNYVVQQRDLLYYKDLMLFLATEQLFLFIILVSLMFLLQMCVLVVNERIDLSMQIGFLKFGRKYRRRKFADFIVRRLLCDLELAMMRLPEDFDEELLHDPEVQAAMQLAKDAAYRAVDIFRRDAANLLFDKMPLSSEVTPYFILKEEEMDLNNAGYSTISLRVTTDVLRQLLYPQS